jgi:transposase
MIRQFQIDSPVCHNDTTSVSFYGEAANNKTDKSILINFGHSKKHRSDLKQLIWSMSVSSDHAFPLFSQAFSGNTADVSTYVQQWHNLIDLLGQQDFLYVADSKLASHENMANINDNGGFFLAPAPMYESYKTVFHQALDEHDREFLIQYKQRFNRGFEVPTNFQFKDKTYPLRMIVLFDHGLCARKRYAAQQRITQTRDDFCQLSKKLNRYNLKTEQAIDKACTDILEKRKTKDFFRYRIVNEPIVTYKNQHRGRPSKNGKPGKLALAQDHYQVELTFDEHAYQRESFYYGYYPLLTNKDAESLSIQQAMLAHKKQYKNEHTFRRAKGPYSIEPIYLHTPERIESFLFLFKMALQVIVLIERTARQSIRQRDQGLDGFMPNRKDVRNPRTEYLLKAFEDIVRGQIPLPDGQTYRFVSELNALQHDILSILEVPVFWYDYNFLFDSS